MQNAKNDRKLVLHSCLLLRTLLSNSHENEGELVKAGLMEFLDAVKSMDSAVSIAVVQLKRSIQSVPFTPYTVFSNKQKRLQVFSQEKRFHTLTNRFITLDHAENLALRVMIHHPNHILLQTDLHELFQRSIHIANHTLRVHEHPIKFLFEQRAKILQIHITQRDLIGIKEGRNGVIQRPNELIRVLQAEEIRARRSLSELFHDLSHRGKRSHRPVDIVIDTLSLRVFASNRDEHRLIIDRDRYQQKLPVLSRRNQGDFWKCLVKRGVEQIVESGFGVRIQQNKMSAMEVTTALHGFHAERTDHERLHMGEENGRRTLSSLFQSIFS